MTIVGDADLLAQRFRTGDAAALRALYDRHAGPRYGFALRCLRDPGDAEDVLQQVFVRAWRARTSFDPARGEVGAWLWGIARRQMADRLAARVRDAEVTARAGRLQDEGRGWAPATHGSASCAARSSAEPHLRRRRARPAAVHRAVTRDELARCPRTCPAVSGW